ERVERGAEDPGVGLLAADDGRVDRGADRRREADLLADRAQIAVEIRDDGEAVALRQAREQRGAPGELGERILRETVPHAPQALRILPEALGEPGRHAADELAEAGGLADRPLEAVARAVEGGLELLARNREPILAEDPMEPLLPGHTFGVERAAEVEEERSGRHRALPLSLRERAGVRGWVSESCSSSTSGDERLPPRTRPGRTQRSSRVRRTRPYATPVEAGIPRST